MTKEQMRQIWRQQQYGYAVMAKLRREELRNFDFWENRHRISGLMQMGADHRKPRRRSGLVEWHRRIGSVKTDPGTGNDE